MRTARVSVVTLLVAVLAACGGGTATSTPTASTSTTEPAAATTTSTTTPSTTMKPIDTTLGTEIPRSTAVLATDCISGWYAAKFDLRFGKGATWPRGAAEIIVKSCDRASTALSIDLVGVPKGDYPIRVLDAVIAEMALVAIEAECAAAPSCFVKSDAFNLAAYGTTINTAFGKPDLSNIPGLRVKG